MKKQINVGDIVVVTRGKHQGKLGIIESIDDGSCHVKFGDDNISMLLTSVKPFVINQITFETLKPGTVIESDEGLTTTVREITEKTVYLNERGSQNQNSPVRLGFDKKFFHSLWMSSGRKIQNQTSTVDIHTGLKFFLNTFVEGINDDHTKITTIKNKTTYRTRGGSHVFVLMKNKSFVLYTDEHKDIVNNVIKNIKKDGYNGEYRLTTTILSHEQFKGQFVNSNGTPIIPIDTFKRVLKTRFLINVND